MIYLSFMNNDHIFDFIGVQTKLVFCRSHSAMFFHSVFRSLQSCSILPAEHVMLVPSAYMLVELFLGTVRRH